MKDDGLYEFIAGIACKHAKTKLKEDIELPPKKMFLESKTLGDFLEAMDKGEE